MKNLYSILKLRPNASEGEIREAINNFSGMHNIEDCRYVLLDPKKKTTFDRCNKTLTQIGKVRANLNLSNGKNWIIYDFSDYNVNPSRQAPILELIINNTRNTASKPIDDIHHVNNKTNGKGNSDSVLYAMASLFLFFVALISIINYTYISSNSENYKDNSQDNSENLNAESGSTPFVSEVDKKSNSTFELPQKPIFEKEPEPLPINGYTYNYTSKRELAPFNIITPQSSTNYFVKMENYNSGQTEFIIFIRGGQSVDVNVPLGTYRVKYATGKDWYGIKYLFGPDDMTSRFLAEDVFRFEDKGTYYSGYTVELIEQYGGNLDTRPLSETSW